MITTIPSDFYPVDGALALREIDDVVKEQDSLVKNSVLLDEGEMAADEASSLKQPIKEECSPSSRTPSTIRRVREAKLTDEQAKTLNDGGVVKLQPQQSNRACSIMVSPIDYIISWKMEKKCFNRRVVVSSQQLTFKNTFLIEGRRVRNEEVRRESEESQ